MRGAACLVVAVLVLSVPCCGCLERYPRPDHTEMEGKVTYLVNSPEVTNASTVDADLWDCAWTIRKIVNSYVDEDDPVDRYWWDEMRIKWGELRMRHRTVSVEGPWCRLEDFRAFERTEGSAFYFEELVGPDNGPDVGDRLLVTSLDRACEGTYFDLRYVGEWYGGVEDLVILVVPESLA